MVAGRLRKLRGVPPYEESEFTNSEKRAYRRTEKDRVLVETGLLETEELFLFLCPFCGYWELRSQRLEPVCNGPTGEHPLEPMILVEGEDRLRFLS